MEGHYDPCPAGRADRSSVATATRVWHSDATVPGPFRLFPVCLPGGRRRFRASSSDLPALPLFSRPCRGRSAAPYTPTTASARCPLGGHEAHQAGGRETRKMLRTAYVPGLGAELAEEDVRGPGGSGGGPEHGDEAVAGGGEALIGAEEVAAGERRLANVEGRGRQARLLVPARGARAVLGGGVAVDGPQ